MALHLFVASIALYTDCDTRLQAYTAAVLETLATAAESYAGGSAILSQAQL
jgi:hypothetical protein